MKPGILTTEFWLVLVTNVLTQAGTLDVPDRYKWIVTAATVVGYAIARGLAKTNPLAVDAGIGFDASLDDPSFNAGAEPHEPTAAPQAWQADAAAAGWQPPAPPPAPTGAA